MEDTGENVASEFETKLKGENFFFFFFFFELWRVVRFLKNNAAKSITVEFRLYEFLLFAERIATFRN